MPCGVTVNCWGTASSCKDAADIGTDTFTGVNNIRGSNYGDTFIGGDGVRRRFRGQQGADTINGGGVFDQADYGRDIAGVSVNLATGLATDGSGRHHHGTNIEDALGSEFNDILLGSGVANILIGQNGNDFTFRRGGNDFQGDDLPSGLSRYGGVFGISTHSLRQLL